MREALLDILAYAGKPGTPACRKDGDVSPRSPEDLVGPYELHDFFLYYAAALGLPAARRCIRRGAMYAFGGTYDRDDDTESGCARSCRRFFQQQFKRSCLPDGPKIGSVALSPRGDLRMPSDACADAWLRELERHGVIE